MSFETLGLAERHPFKKKKQIYYAGLEKTTMSSSFSGTTPDFMLSILDYVVPQHRIPPYEHMPSSKTRVLLTLSWANSWSPCRIHKKVDFSTQTCVLPGRVRDRVRQ
jgi:hypothetical protein